MKNITVSVDDDLYRDARVEAARQHKSLSALGRELLVGTNVQSAGSVFKVEAVAPTGPGGSFVITFTAQAGRSYTVQYRTSLSSGSWLEVADVAAGAAGAVQVTDSGSIGQPARFYRIVTPAQ